MLVYVTSPDQTQKATRKLEDVVFKNETLAIGTKFFRCVKITESEAAQDRILAAAGRGSPRLLMIRRDYTVDTVVSKNSCNAGKIIRGMKSVVKKTYVNSFDKMVKGYIKLLTRRDGLESVRARLADKKKRLEEKPNAGAAKKLARDQQEYDRDMAEWLEDQKKLLEVKLKVDKKTQA